MTKNIKRILCPERAAKEFLKNFKTAPKFAGQYHCPAGIDVREPYEYCAVFFHSFVLLHACGHVRQPGPGQPPRTS